MLPIGVTALKHVVRAFKLAPSSWPSLLKSVLAVSYAQSADEDAVLAANIAGVVYVTHVDLEGGRVTVLAPSPVAMPGAVLLTGTIKWMEAR